MPGKLDVRHVIESPFSYCGVFSPCKNCNIETQSRDYATIDEAVFSPCLAEQSRAEPNRAAINTWVTQEWGRVTWPRQHVTSRASSDATIKAFSRMSDQVSITVRRRSSREFSMGDNRGRFVVKEDSLWAVVSWVLGVSCEECFWREDLCVIFGVWDSYSLCVESRCEETTSGENPSACATVNCKVCISARGL
jgi:hypothetical protein